MGFEMAMSELSLVLFTTIAPSGAVAVALMVVCSPEFSAFENVCIPGARL